MTWPQQLPPARGEGPGQRIARGGEPDNDPLGARPVLRLRLAAVGCWLWTHGSVGAQHRPVGWQHPAALSELAPEAPPPPPQPPPPPPPLNLPAPRYPAP